MARDATGNGHAAGRTLAIECATEACSVALFDDSDLIAGEFAVLGRGHAEALVPMIAQLPDKGRAARIVVGLGPGSFTGVRIGLAAARALALAWGAEAVGYPTLALVAAMARAQSGARPVLVANTAGHGEWFVQGFDGDGGSFMPLASLKAEETDLLAGQLPAGLIVVGSQAGALAARLRANGWNGGEGRELWPDARQIMTLPPQAVTSDLAPLYGRAPDARLPGSDRAPADAA